MGSNNQGKLIFNFREDKRLKMTEMLNSHRHEDSAVRKKLQKKKGKDGKQKINIIKKENKVDSSYSYLESSWETNRVKHSGSR